MTPARRGPKRQAPSGRVRHDILRRVENLASDKGHARRVDLVDRRRDAVVKILVDDRIGRAQSSRRVAGSFSRRARIAVCRTLNGVCTLIQRGSVADGTLAEDDGLGCEKSMASGLLAMKSQPSRPTTCTALLDVVVIDDAYREVRCVDRTDVEARHDRAFANSTVPPLLPGYFPNSCPPSRRTKSRSSVTLDAPESSSNQ